MLLVRVSSKHSAKQAADHRFVAELGPGECFGEMGILHDLPRSASVVAIQDTEVPSRSKEKLRGLLLSYPELGVGILVALSRRLRDANTRSLNGKTTRSSPRAAKAMPFDFDIP